MRVLDARLFGNPAIPDSFYAFTYKSMYSLHAQRKPDKHFLSLARLSLFTTS